MLSISEGPIRRQIVLDGRSIRTHEKMAEHLPFLIDAFSKASGIAEVVKHDDVARKTHEAQQRAAFAALTEGRLPSSLPTEGIVSTGGVLPAMRLIQNKGRFVLDFPVPGAVSRRASNYDQLIDAVSKCLTERGVVHKKVVA